MFRNFRRRDRAFSLIELVIVVVIIAIIGAIAIPRMSRGSKGASDSALIADLAVLRNAIDLYYTEHQVYPSVAAIVDQLTQFTSLAGATSATKDATHYYGPYIRAIPPLPVGAKKGSTGIDNADGASIGWIYDATTGTIKANCTNGEIDDAGKAYNTY